MMKPTKKYSDMMALPRHRSPRRAPMSRADRAAQFAPFAALTGFDGMIAETGRLTDPCAELADEEVALLDETLRRIFDRLAERPCVTVTWFVPDQRKKGGAYVSAEGNVVRIDLYKREVHLHTGAVIPIDRVCAIEERQLTAE